jgi:hypothetical protein
VSMHNIKLLDVPVESCQRKGQSGGKVAKAHAPVERDALDCFLDLTRNINAVSSRLIFSGLDNLNGLSTIE